MCVPTHEESGIAYVESLAEHRLREDYGLLTLTDFCGSALS